MKKKSSSINALYDDAVTALGCGGKKNDTAEGTEAAESVNGTGKPAERNRNSEI